MAKVGYRFHPTDEELIEFYLTNQILGYKERVVETISEINFYEHDPIYLPSLSRNQSDNGIYYFFALKQYTNSSKRFRKRSSENGKWKLTGDDTEIKDNKSGEKIGDKHVFVYQKPGSPKAKGIKSCWVMHEYQITHSQSYPNLNLDTYVICKLFDKREEAESSHGNNSSDLEPTDHSNLVSDSNPVGEMSTFPNTEVDEQPGQDIDSLLRSNDLSIRMNIDQEEDLPLWDYTLSNPNNYYNDLSNVTPYLPQAYDEFFNQGQFGHTFSDQDFTLMQPCHHENSYGMFANDDFAMPMNTQEDHSFDPNMPPYLSQSDAVSISEMSYQRPWSTDFFNL